MAPWIFSTDHVHATNSDAVSGAPGTSPFWLKWKLELKYGYLNVVMFSRLVNGLSTHSISR